MAERARSDSAWVLPPSVSDRIRLPIPSSLLAGGWSWVWSSRRRCRRRRRSRPARLFRFCHPSIMEPPEELESPSSILQVWRFTSQPRRHWLLAEQAGLAPAGDLTTPQRLSKPRSYGFLSTAPNSSKYTLMLILVHEENNNLHNSISHTKSFQTKL